MAPRFPGQCPGGGCLRHEITSLGAPFTLLGLVCLSSAQLGVPRKWGDTLRDVGTYPACAPSSSPCQWALCFCHCTRTLSSGCGRANDGIFWLKHLETLTGLGGVIVGQGRTQRQGQALRALTYGWEMRRPSVHTGNRQTSRAGYGWYREDPCRPGRLCAQGARACWWERSWSLSGCRWRECAACWGLAVDGAPNHTFEIYRMGTDVGLPFLVSPLPSLQAQTRSVPEVSEPVIDRRVQLFCYCQSQGFGVRPLCSRCS